MKLLLGKNNITVHVFLDFHRAAYANVVLM